MWVLFFLGLLGPLFSSYVGNPSAPALLQEGLFISDRCWSNPQLGLVEDFLLQKKLRARHSCKSMCARKATIAGNAQIGDLVWSIKERLNIQLQLGSGSVEWSWIQQNQMVKGQSKEAFLWGGSAKAVLLEVKDTSFGATGQAGGWDKTGAHTQLNGVSMSKQAKVCLRYWQAGAAVTQKIGVLAPYIGCLANQTEFKVSRIETGTVRLKSQIVAGPFVGCTLSTGSRLYLNVEWRGWFEQGVALSGQIRF